MKHKSKVFVVDDNEAVRTSLEAILKIQGYNVQSFPTATHFLAQHHPTQVGCVLVNLAMTDLGGRLLLKRLQESRSLLSVVIISGLVISAIVDGDTCASGSLHIRQYELSALLCMVEDAIAGSLRRRAKWLRERPNGDDRKPVGTA